MAEQINNYEEEKEKKRKKIIPLFFLLALAIVLSIGLVVAFFSDVFEHSSNFTTGTLNITGNYSFYVNDVLVPSGNISNLNPGDIVVIKANVTNSGNKSAWIRNAITFTTENIAILPYLEIYSGEFDREDLATDLDDYQLTINDGTAVSGNYVIDGSGIDAETEDGGDYDYLKSPNYQFAITIYFNSSATNEMQGKTFGLAVKTQALQFRNNNASEPNETAWATVSAVV